jgi:predicted O-linked N-acetylglucosamine transferase (SPINDLY family)
MNAPKDSKNRLEAAQDLHRRGRTKEAESSYRKIISGNPRHARALSSLGVLLCESGRIDEARQYLERASAIEPQPRDLTNLGVVYRLQGRLDLAAEAFGRVLEVAPDFPDAYLNLGVILLDVGVYAEALPLLEQASKLGPDSPRLRLALARALLKLLRPAQSLLHARRAVEMAPSAALAHRQLADALDACGQKTEAIASYRRAIELDPADYGAHSDLIIAMLLDPSFDARAHFAEASAWARQHAEPMRQYVRPLTNEKATERRLRVGYVSPDFRAHAIQQFLVPLLQHHDAQAFEVFLYSSVARADPETRWYQDFAGDRFRDIRGLDDVQAAELVRRDGIDILVDLALHSPGGRLRLFACKPAPVQISWLGYPGTTGLETIDYRITDPFVDPLDTDLGVYSEESLRLPETLWCYSSLNPELTVSPLPALSSGYVTFGSQNSYRKLHPRLLALWARLLAAVDGSRLFLYAEKDESDMLRDVFAREGVEAGRLQFEGRVSRPEYLRRYANIDIALDTFPFNGATTTLDAAWMGVPVVTLRGAVAVQRGGSCILHHLGLPELIADSEAAYLDKAVALARDLERLSALRQTLRARLESSPLGNAPRFAAHLEAAYRETWRRYCATA